MATDEEDPRELVAQELERTRALSQARDESRKRAASNRKLRIVNGWDRLLADLLGGRA